MSRSLSIPRRDHSQSPNGIYQKLNQRLCFTASPRRYPPFLKSLGLTNDAPPLLNMAQSTSNATGSPLGTHAGSNDDIATTPSTIHDIGVSTQRTFKHTENPDTQRLNGQRIDSSIRDVSPAFSDTGGISLQNHGSHSDYRHSDYHHSHTNNSGDSPVATHLSTNPRHNHSKNGPTHLEAYSILPVHERFHEPPAWSLKIQLLPLNVNEIITHLRVLGTDYSVIQSLLRDLPSEYIDLITIRVKARNGHLRSVHRIRKRDIVTATGSFKPESAIFVLETSEVAEEEKPIKHASGAAAAKATGGQFGSAVGSFGRSQTSDSLSTTMAPNKEYSSNSPFAEPMTSGTGHVTSTRSKWSPSSEKPFQAVLRDDLWQNPSPVSEHSSDQMIVRRTMPSMHTPDRQYADPLVRVHYHHLGKRDFHHELVEPLGGQDFASNTGTKGSGNEVSRETWNPTSSSSQPRPSVYSPSAFGSQPGPYSANRWTVDNPPSGSQSFDSQPGASPFGASAIQPEPYFPNECDDFFQNCDKRQSRLRQLIQPSIDEGNACQNSELEDTSVGGVQHYESNVYNPEYQQYSFECQSQHTSMCSPDIAPSGWSSAPFEEPRLMDREAGRAGPEVRGPDFCTVISDTGNQLQSEIASDQVYQLDARYHNPDSGRLVADKPSTPSTLKNTIELAAFSGSQTSTPQHVGSWSPAGACPSTASSPTASNSTSRLGGYAFPGGGGNSSAIPPMPSPRGGNGPSKFQFDSLAGTRLDYALAVSPFGSPRRTPKDVPPFGSSFDSLAQGYDYPMMDV